MLLIKLCFSLRGVVEVYTVLVLAIDCIHVPFRLPIP